MSWRPEGNDASWGPSPTYHSSSRSNNAEEQSSRDRLRLPPLSTLLSSSARPSPSPHSPNQRSPLPSHTAASLPLPPRLSPKESYNDQQSSSSYERHFQPSSSLRQIDSKITYSGIPVNLPPLTSLSLHTRSPTLLHHLPSSAPSGPLPSLPPRLPSSSTYSPISRSGETYATTASSSKSTTSSSIGPMRRRINSASTVGRPYQRPHPGYDAEYFNHVSNTRTKRTKKWAMTMDGAKAAD